MIVISLTDCPMKLRGYLTKYLCEISTGVYVGKVSAKVRDGLWQRVCDNCTHGRAVMVINSDNEQGYDFRVWNTTWVPVDLDGFKVMLRPEIQRAEQTETHAAQVKSQEEYVVLDFETTGIDVKHDRILEVGALLVQNQEVTASMSEIIRQEATVPADIQKLTGITDEMAGKGMDLREALEKLRLFIGNRIVIGYNIREFDEKILAYECKRCSGIYPIRKSRDVLRMVKRVYPEMHSYRMQSVAEALNLSIDEKHRALDDCYTCDKIYKAITQQG